MSGIISHEDATDLERLEAVVRRGKKTFIKVGNALSEIRDRKLYRTTHKTFAVYVEDRFGFKRHNAYQLIEAADAAKNVEHVQQLDNPRQAAELAKAPTEKQVEVVKRANEIVTQTGKPLTTKILSEARAEVCHGEGDAPPKGRALKRRSATSAEPIDRADRKAKMKQIAKDQRYGDGTPKDHVKTCVLESYRRICSAIQQNGPGTNKRWVSTCNEDDQRELLMFARNLKAKTDELAGYLEQVLSSDDNETETNRIEQLIDRLKADFEPYERIAISEALSALATQRGDQ